MGNEYTIDFYNANNEIESVDFSTIASLIGYKNPYKCNFSYLLNEAQIEFICEQMNSLVLEMLNLSKQSIIEIVLQQSILAKNLINSIQKSEGDRFDITNIAFD